VNRTNLDKFFVKVAESIFADAEKRYVSIPSKTLCYYIAKHSSESLESDVKLYLDDVCNPNPKSPILLTDTTRFAKSVSEHIVSMNHVVTGSRGIKFFTQVRPGGRGTIDLIHFIPGYNHPFYDDLKKNWMRYRERLVGLFVPTPRETPLCWSGVPKGSFFQAVSSAIREADGSEFTANLFTRSDMFPAVAGTIALRLEDLIRTGKYNTTKDPSNTLSNGTQVMLDAGKPLV